MDEYIARFSNDEERASSVGNVADGPAVPGDSADANTLPQSVFMPVPRRGSSSAIAMPSPGMHGNVSLVANSYQEAVAHSLRKRGYSFGSTSLLDSD